MTVSFPYSRLAAVLLAGAVLASACSGGDEVADQATDPTADQAPTDGQIDGQGDVVAGDDTTTQPDVVTAGFDIDTVLAGDPNCPGPVTGEPLRIGFAADLGEIGGPADRPGSQAAVHLAKLINCTGGIDGVPVEVLVEDISGDPLATRAAVKRLLDAGVSVLLGPPFPDPGFRVLQQTNSNVAVIFTGSTEPALGNDAALSYLVSFNDTQGATAAAQFALSNGWNRAVTFSSPGPYFGYNTLVFSGVFGSSGGEVISDYEFIPIEQTEFPDAVAQIAADPPDVIYTPMFAHQLVALRQQLEAAGVTDVEYMQSDAFEATDGYTLPGIDGIYHVTHTFPSDDSRTTALVNSMAETNGVPPGAPSFAALAGDAIAVIADSYLRVRTTDPKILGEAIADAADVQGVTGVISYNGSGLPTKPMYIHHVQNGAPTLAATIGG